MRLIYASKVSPGFNPSDIQSILEGAKKYNNTRDISGILCFTPEYFLQCIEGSRTNINELFNKILTDQRHSNVELLNYREINKRSFSDWGMEYVPANKLTSNINLKYSGKKDFNPYKMQGESCHDFLVDLCKANQN